MIFSKRKRTRIPGFDYSSSGFYFITLCTESHKEILSRIVDDTECFKSTETSNSNNVGTIVPDGPKNGLFKPPKVILTRYGKIVKNRIEEMSDFYENISINKYVIMPNHIHFLIEIKNGIFGPSGTMVPTAMYSVLSRFIGTFKRFTNKEIGHNIWQSRSYVHVVRNEKDYLEIWKYIEYNPVMWKDDKLFNF